MKTCKRKGGGFFEAAHHIHGLNGRTGRAFHQVVDGGQADHPAGWQDQIEADIDEIGTGQDLGSGTR